MNPSFDQKKKILVFGEVRQNTILSITYELTGKAAELGKKLHADVYTLVLYDQLNESPEDLLSYGADHILVVQDERLRLFNQDISMKIGIEIIQMLHPEIVLAGATTSGRTFMPAIAGKIHTGLTADCTGLDIEEGSGLLLQTRPAIGGNVMATIKTPSHRPQMATVRPKTFAKPCAQKGSGTIIYCDLPEECFRSKVVPISFENVPEEYVNIQDLEVIVTGGKGIKRPETFALLQKTAKLLRGGVGASRPTVEAKWISYPHQVGLSGKVVSPKFYLAVGVSGAVQHLAGMQTSEFIVAINKDEDAGIFKVANIGLCGDLFEILPLLIAAIEKERGVAE